MKTFQPESNNENPLALCKGILALTYKKTLILISFLFILSLKANAQEIRRDYQLHFYVGTAIGASTMNLPGIKQHSGMVGSALNVLVVEKLGRKKYPKHK